MQVVIGEQFVVPAYSKVSLLRQPINQDSDKELEYADDSSGVAMLVIMLEFTCGFIGFALF